MATSVPQFGNDLRGILQKLHDAGQEDSGGRQVEEICRDLLHRSNRYDAIIVSVHEWLKERHPQTCASDTLAELQEKAESADARSQKSKASEERRYLTHLSFIYLNWSVPIVQHYKWDTCRHKKLRSIYRCVKEWPDFGEFVPLANCILLLRHCDAVADVDAKVDRFIGKEATFTGKEWDWMANLRRAPQDVYGEHLEPDCTKWRQNEVSTWSTCRDGSVIVKGRRLDEWRNDSTAFYFLEKDENGLLRRRPSRPVENLVQHRSNSESPSPNSTANFADIGYQVRLRDSPLTPLSSPIFPLGRLMLASTATPDSIPATIARLPLEQQLDQDLSPPFGQTREFREHRADSDSSRPSYYCSSRGSVDTDEFEMVPPVQAEFDVMRNNPAQNCSAIYTPPYRTGLMDSRSLETLSISDSVPTDDFVYTPATVHLHRTFSAEQASSPPEAGDIEDAREAQNSTASVEDLTPWEQDPTAPEQEPMAFVQAAMAPERDLMAIEQDSLPIRHHQTVPTQDSDGAQVMESITACTPAQEDVPGDATTDFLSHSHGTVNWHACTDITNLIRSGSPLLNLGRVRDRIEPMRGTTPIIRDKAVRAFLTNVGPLAPRLPVQDTAKPSSTAKSRTSADERPYAETRWSGRHEACVRKHIFKIASEADTSRPTRQCIARAYWLNDDTRRATMSPLGFSASENSSASTEGSVDVLRLTSEDFIKRAKEDMPFDRPVIIKESFTDSPIHSVGGAVQTLHDACNDVDVKVWTLEDEGCKTVSMGKVSDWVKSNARAISAMDLPFAYRTHQPVFTQLSRYSAGIVAAQRANLQRRHHPSEDAGELDGCLSFNHLSTPGAFSGIRVNVLGSTWFRNLTGLQICMYVPKAEMATRWKDFEKDGPDWNPRGAQRFFILEPNDVAFLPSHLVHAFYTMETTVTVGGAVWDECDITAPLKSLQWARRHEQCANWPLRTGLSSVLRGLEELVTANTPRYARHQPDLEFLDEFRKVMGDFASDGERGRERRRRRLSNGDYDDDTPDAMHKRRRNSGVVQGLQVPRPNARERIEQWRAATPEQRGYMELCS